MSSDGGADEFGPNEDPGAGPRECPLCGQPYAAANEEGRAGMSRPSYREDAVVCRTPKTAGTRTAYVHLAGESESVTGGDSDELSVTDAHRCRPVETPLDPPDLVLNPHRDAPTRRPVCPDCGEAIVGVQHEDQRRFECGCDDLREFVFRDGGDEA